MSGPYVPPGQSPPFQVVDDLHHGAWIIITGALGLVVSLVSFFIRLYVRLALHPPFAFDDYLLLGATAALLFNAVSHGFGTSIYLLEQKQVDKIQTLITVSDILYLITVYISKCCVCGIYLRLTPQKWHNRASIATLALCTAWVIPAVFIIAVNCELNRPWKGSGGQCVNLSKRWQFIVALDIATELIIFGLAVFLLWGLFMPLKRKLTIGFAFMFRLPLIIFSVFHIYTILLLVHSPDPTLAVVTPIIWAQVELNYALVACSIFCLRPFMAAVSTNYGTAGDSNLESTSGVSRSWKGDSSKAGSGRQIYMNHEERRSWRVSRRLDGGHQAGPVAETDIELGEMDGQRSVGSDGGSAKMMIRKDVEYTIEYDRHSDLCMSGADWR
ncbi:hypothetical protein AtubIFM55763_001355 [Aspergillus tubingensis]|uniref:Rhodopsin domain-containing protein n=1 Tax=Aspergillus tubingensis TaxID=5068 RepID=A0A9W6EK43_ASPTU|nr:hypothetical protein AtubIFM54640_003301 [Aspergillus tubingensis]GLA71075.1 hypothetical protein AtubIFM55763_001355 [Aspergillus tubingensis]GLA82020.1 hypothetical protein AtubIFM56815_006199 [Aspergillus tubingensis]GLA93042.1 hypothetical protein AtubIFM57143_010021 [Aspergillus tubingensis]GLB18257.1 hypothetical protein AtubIFM61612_008148 [Aspergillus tubingensis]